ncbi:unnamed protein product, partial [Protopolystoma xenopodis]
MLSRPSARQNRQRVQNLNDRRSSGSRLIINSPTPVSSGAADNVSQSIPYSEDIGRNLQARSANSTLLATLSSGEHRLTTLTAL